MIIEPQMNHYLENLIPERDPLLSALEQQARDQKIPIIQLSSIQLIRTLLLAIQPKSILELGTAIGYSTIWLARSCPQARITTLEIDEERIEQALANFQAAGVSGRIELLARDAGLGLPADYRFDCLFFDAAKGQYKTYLDLYLPLLEPGGIVICDNVLFKGMVAQETVENKRLAPMVRKLREFNCYIMGHPELDTSFIPIGDGLTFSVKKRKVNDDV